MIVKVHRNGKRVLIDCLLTEWQQLARELSEQGNAMIFDWYPRGLKQAAARKAGRPLTKREVRKLEEF